MYLHIFTYIYIYLHLFTYIYIYLHIFTYIYIYLHIFTYIYIHLHTFTYIYIQIHTFTYIYIYLDVFTSIYIYLHLFTYTYIYLHIFTYIYTEWIDFVDLLDYLIVQSIVQCNFSYLGLWSWLVRKTHGCNTYSDLFPFSMLTFNIYLHIFTYIYYNCITKLIIMLIFHHSKLLLIKV